MSMNLNLKQIKYKQILELLEKEETLEIMVKNYIKKMEKIKTKYGKDSY
jgi:chaperonin cofactor prefoldin